MKKIRTLILVFFACVLCIPAVSVSAQESVNTDESNVGKVRSAVGSNVTIVPGKVHSYGSWSTNEFWVTTETGKYLGFCAEPTKTTTNGLYRVSKMEQDVIETLVLTYTIPELWNVFGKEFYQSGNAYAFCHAAIGYIYTGQMTGISGNAIAGIKNLVAVVTHLVNGTERYEGSEKTEWIHQYLEQYQLYIAYNDSQDIVWVEKEPKVTVDLKLTKVQMGTQVTIPGTKFEHINPKGVSKTVTTDVDGSITISDLEIGSHIIRELEASDGYLVNNVDIYFQVKANGEIIVNSETQSNETILFDIISEHTSKKVITMTVGNKTVPYSLILHKENENGIRLEGTEFALYQDKECTLQYASGITDKDGTLQFQMLENGVSYYLKETKAPLGYSPLLDELGTPVVTEIKAYYVPASGEGHWYVDGKEEEVVFEYTESGPMVTMTTINEIGYTLPQTGSSDELKLVLMAAIIFVISIWLQIYDNKGRKRRSNMKKRKIVSVLLALTLLVGNMSMMTTHAATESAKKTSIDCKMGEAQVVISGNEGQPIQGKEFLLYKLFSAENDIYGESVHYTFNPSFQDILQTLVGSKIGKESIQVTEQEVLNYIQSLKGENSSEASNSKFRYFIEELRNNIQERRIQGTHIKVEDASDTNSFTIKGLEYGYYIIDEVTSATSQHQALSLCMVSTANPNATVHLKSDYPNVVLKIREDDRQDEIQNQGWNDIGDFEIGQSIPYRYESKVPNMDGYSLYYMAWHSKMHEALTMKTETIQVKLSGTINGVEEEYTLSDNEINLITVSADGISKIEIKDLKAIAAREFPEKTRDDTLTIVACYDAFLNEKAVTYTGRPGIENDVRLEFSNNPNVGAETQTGMTPWDTVVCFTYQIQGVKINNYGTPLEGAVFRLYRDSECKDEVLVKKLENGFQVVHNDAVTADTPNNQGISSNAKGEFYIYGLDGGIYYLKEMSAPKGYRVSEEMVKVTLQPQFTDERNNYIKGEGAGDEILKTDGSLEVSIVNEAGKKLPVTGSQMMIILCTAGVGCLTMAVIRGWKKHE